MAHQRRRPARGRTVRVRAALSRARRAPELRGARGAGRHPGLVLDQRAVGDGHAALLGEAAGPAPALLRLAGAAHGDPHRHGGGRRPHHDAPQHSRHRVRLRAAGRARARLRRRVAGVGVPGLDARPLRAGNDPVVCLPAVRSRGLARLQRAPGAGVLHVGSLLPAAHAGGGRLGARGPHPARARGGRDAAGAAGGRRARARADRGRDRHPRRARGRAVRGGAIRARPSGAALEARGPARAALAMRALAARLRTAAWLGWQIESNWAAPFLFIVYAVLRPLAMALILAGMYWAVASRASRGETFMAFYIANAFHVYVTQVMVGMGWVVVEEREDYETLKYVYTSPMGMLTYLGGRSTVKIMLGTVSMLLALTVGWFLLDLRWDWAHVAWGPLVLSFALGLVACVHLGFVVAGAAMLLPRIAITLNEALAVALYLLCGVIFPIDLLPFGLRQLALVFPFTYWYEALRRFLLGHGASAQLGAWSDATLLGVLAATTLAFVLLSHWGYQAMERHARRLGRLDQTSLF